MLDVEHVLFVPSLHRNELDTAIYLAMKDSYFIITIVSLVSSKEELKDELIDMVNDDE